MDNYMNKPHKIKTEFEYDHQIKSEMDFVDFRTDSNRNDDTLNCATKIQHDIDDFIKSEIVEPNIKSEIDEPNVKCEVDETIEYNDHIQIVKSKHKGSIHTKIVLLPVGSPLQQVTIQGVQGPITKIKSEIEQKMESSHTPYNHKNQDGSENLLEQGATAMRYKCEQCEFETNLGLDLQRHKLSKHQRIREFKRRIEISEINKYNCDQCEYKADRKDCLVLHIKSIHEGLKYSCEKCEFQASTIQDLQSHLQSVHVGITFECEQCEYKTDWKHGLKLHRKSVHGAIEYICEHCEYKTNRKQTLQRHIKSHFQSEYICEHCEYKTNRKQTIQRHIRSHFQSVHARIIISKYK